MWSLALKDQKIELIIFESAYEAYDYFRENEFIIGHITHLITDYYLDRHTIESVPLLKELKNHPKFIGKIYLATDAEREGHLEHIDEMIPKGKFVF